MFIFQRGTTNSTILLVIVESQFFLLSSNFLSLSVHAPLTFPLLFYVLSSCVQLLFGLFSPVNIFHFFPHLVVTFKLKQILSLNIYIHIKNKTASFLWDEIFESPLLSLADEPFQSFGPRNRRLRACLALILQEREHEAQGGKDFLLLRSRSFWMQESEC